jgi:hypothetical protein
MSGSAVVLGMIWWTLQALTQKIQQAHNSIYTLLPLSCNVSCHMSSDAAVGGMLNIYQKIYRSQPAHLK